MKESAESKWMDGLEKFQVLVYRRMNFFGDDYEYERDMGRRELENLFVKQQIDLDTTSIILVFPEQWLNHVQMHGLYPRLAHYYPNLKQLQIKTREPLILTNTPNKYAFMLPSEDEMTRETNGHREDVDDITYVNDSCPLFTGISTGKIFVNGKPLD